MSAGRIDLGRCACPVCSSTGAHLRVSVKQLAYVTCNACNVQIMARSDRSDALLRGFLLADDAPPAATAPAAPPRPAAAPPRPAAAPPRPAAAPTAPTAPAAPTAPTAPAAPAAPSRAWGFLK